MTWAMQLACFLLAATWAADCSTDSDTFMSEEKSASPYARAQQVVESHFQLMPFPSIRSLHMRFHHTLLFDVESFDVLCNLPLSLVTACYLLGFGMNAGVKYIHHH